MTEPSRSPNELSLKAYGRKVQYVLDGHNVHSLLGSIQDMHEARDRVTKLTEEAHRLDLSPEKTAIDILEALTQLYIRERRSAYESTRSSHSDSHSNDSNVR